MRLLQLVNVSPHTKLTLWGILWFLPNEPLTHQMDPVDSFSDISPDHLVKYEDITALDPLALLQPLQRHMK